MYEEEKYSEFDRCVREMLSDAREEVPSRVWKGVSGRLKVRKYSAGWSHPIIGMACAAALSLGIILTPRLVESLTHDTFSPISLVAQAPALDVRTDFPDLTGMSGRPSAAPVSTPSGEIGDPGTAAEEQEEATASAGTSAVGTAKNRSAHSSHGDGRTSRNAPDPLDLLAYEESRSSSRGGRADMDIRGVISSNDDIAMGARPGRMMARSGSGSFASGISQSGEDTFGIPVSFQVGARIFVNDWLGFGTGVSYSLLTRSFEGNLIENGTIAQTGLDILHTAQYVGVPLNIYFNIVGHGRTHVYAFMGGMGEKCISSRYDLRGMAENKVLSEKVSPLQWSAGIGFGMQYDITRHLGFYVDPSARYYFDCAQPRTVRTSKPFMFDFAVGLRFNL